MLDLRQTSEYLDYLNREGWFVERINKVNYFIRKMPFGLNVLKLQRPEILDYKVVDNLCRKYRIFQIIVEPKYPDQAIKLINFGFKLSKNTYLPSKTLCIDLRQNQKNIYNRFKRNIKTGIKRGEGLIVKKYSTPIEIKFFRKEWKRIIKNKLFVPGEEQLLNLRKSFPSNKSLFLASHNISGDVIGGVIFTITSHGTSNYIISYLYGFTSKEGRASLAHATLLYQGILWGKKMGCKLFDFEGVYDSRFPNRSWLGFTRFKKSFGGFEIAYPGCFIKYRFP